MKITADTNVLVRVIVGDDEKQAQIARRQLAQAEIVALTLPTFCELCWVLARGYKISSAEIAHAIRLLIESANIATNRAAVEARLALLEAGGDFADGVIAFEGAWLGAETYVSFDKSAVRLLEARGYSARHLS